MSGKLLVLASAAALPCSIAATSAREPVRLADDQLDKITAGSDLSQTPLVASLLVNGSNGPGGVNQFSPSIATLIPTMPQPFMPFALSSIRPNASWRVVPEPIT